MSEEQMTIDGAIRLLDPATSIEVLAEMEKVYGARGIDVHKEAIGHARELACEIMRDYKETKDALAGMEIMLANATSAVGTLERRLAAALGDLRGTCGVCRHNGDAACPSNECMDCVRGSSWEWRGER